MKTTPKRNRSDSASAAVRAAQAVALGPLDPPEHVSLREGDRPFWDAIVTSRTRDTWTLPDLAMAANMAHAQADVKRLQAQLDFEGYMIDGKPNPLVMIVETLIKRCVALARVLHVHAQATVGESKDAAKSLQNEKQAREHHNKLSDSLIPTLRMVA